MSKRTWRRRYSFLFGVKRKLHALSLLLLRLIRALVFQNIFCFEFEVGRLRDNEHVRQLGNQLSNTPIRMKSDKFQKTTKVCLLVRSDSFCWKASSPPAEFAFACFLSSWACAQARLELSCAIQRTWPLSRSRERNLRLHHHSAYSRFVKEIDIFVCFWGGCHVTLGFGCFGAAPVIW